MRKTLGDDTADNVVLARNEVMSNPCFTGTHLDGLPVVPCSTTCDGRPGTCRPEIQRPSLSRCAQCGLVGSFEQREQYLHYFLRPDLAVNVLVNEEKLLGVGQSDWYHHPSASLELID
jgi:hypothetical protein